MALPLATSSDVATKLQRALSSVEEAAANVYLREASALLRRRISGLDGLLADGTIDSDLAQGVVTDSVVRVLRNPSGVSSQAIGSESASWGGSRSVGKVVITDDEVATLLPVQSGVAGMAVGTARLRAPWWVTAATWQEEVAPWEPTPYLPWERER